MPDKFIPVDTTEYSEYYRKMVASGNLHKFCLNYVDENRKALKKKYANDDDFVSDFIVTDEIMADLIEQCEKDSVKYDEEQYRCSENLIKVAVKGNMVQGGRITVSARRPDTFNPLATNFESLTASAKIFSLVAILIESAGAYSTTF